MKKLMILLSLFSILFCFTTSYAIEMNYRGADLGERIPDYYLVQFKYDYTKAGIDYYTARQSEIKDDITRIAIYQNRLMSVDIINTTAKYKLFFIATIQVLEIEYGKFDYMNSISKQAFEYIWAVDKNNQIVITFDEQAESCTWTFLSKKLLKKYLKETTVL